MDSLAFTAEITVINVPTRYPRYNEPKRRLVRSGIHKNKNYKNTEKNTLYLSIQVVGSLGRFKTRE